MTELQDDIRAQIEKAREVKPRTRRGKLESLPGHLKLHLVRELASGATLTEMAELYDCSPASVMAFRDRHNIECKNIDDEFVNKRIAAVLRAVAQELERLCRRNHGPAEVLPHGAESARKFWPGINTGAD